MRRGSRSQGFFALVVLAAGTAMAGCNGSPDPSATSTPVRPTVVPTTNASGTTTSPTSAPGGGPVVPAAARAHTNAGAQAFAEFYLRQLNKAWTIPDPEQIRPYSTAACKTCSAYISTAEEMQAQGQHYDGPPIKILAATFLPESDAARPLVRVLNVQEKRKIVDSRGKVVDTVLRDANEAQLEMVWKGAPGWQVDEVKYVQVQE